MELTSRQRQILKAVVEEYIETAEPVGSDTLDKKYNLGVSPATLRNEMVKLMKAGYLKQLHTSAGRVPTSLSLKLYVSELMKPQELKVADEVAVKEKVWDYRMEFNKLLRQITRELAEKTRTLALATSEEGDLFYSGAANILDMPEFWDIDITKTVLSLLDRFDHLQGLIDRSVSTEPIHILLGEEMGSEFLEPCGIIYARYDTGRHRGVVGVMGPSRFNYPVVIPTVRYFGDLLNEVARW